MMLGLSVASPAALDAVIYQEVFGGASNVYLNADTTDAVGYGASIAWAANDFFNANGSFNRSVEGGA